MSGKLILANDVLKYTVLAGEIRNQYMEVVPAYYMREAPAADAVEVVRCRDCKYAMLLIKPEGNLIADCRIRKMNSEDERFCMVRGDDFCSFGERR